MIAQDATDIFSNYSTYEDAYLDYLFGPASAGVVPSDADVIPCLVIYELGVRTRSHRQRRRQQQRQQHQRPRRGRWHEIKSKSSTSTRQVC
jgi:hypothetical protein